MARINDLEKLCYFFYKKAQEALKKKDPTISDLAEELAEFENVPLPEDKDEDIDLESSDVVSPNLAHNDYLITVANTFNIKYESVTTEMMNQFVKDNIVKIKKLRSFFGKSRPVYLGSGVDGVVFDIGNGLVAKFLIDPFTIRKAEEAMESLYQQTSTAKTEAMIHEVDSIGTTPGSEVPVFYIIMEKMTPVSEFKSKDPGIYWGLYRLAGFIKRKIEDIFEKEVWRNDRNRRAEVLKKELHQKIIEITEACKAHSEPQEIISFINECIENAYLNLREDWLERFVEEIFDKVATERGDLHLGNLGITGYGTLCFYDPAHKYFVARIN